MAFWLVHPFSRLHTLDLPCGHGLQPLSSGRASHVTEGLSLDPGGLSLLPAPCRGRLRCERKPGADSLTVFREAGAWKVVQ